MTQIFLQAYNGFLSEGRFLFIRNNFSWISPGNVNEVISPVHSNDDEFSLLVARHVSNFLYKQIYSANNYKAVDIELWLSSK